MKITKRAVDSTLNKLPRAEGQLHQVTREVNDVNQRKRYLLRDVDFLEGKKSSLTAEISYLGVWKSNLDEYCNQKKDEVVKMVGVEQSTQKLMNKCQEKIIMLIFGAVRYSMKTLGMNLSRIIEIHEMHKGDIAE